MLSPALQKGNTCRPTNCHARSRDGGLRTHASRRRSLQTACKQCLRSSKRHRAFLDLSVSGRGRTWWARRQIAALHNQVTDLSHSIVVYSSQSQVGWPPKLYVVSSLSVQKMLRLRSPTSTAWLPHIMFPSLLFLLSNPE